MSRSKAIALLLPALAASTALAVPRPACAGNITTHCEYDYIVVGAGAAGLTVANRLSEDPEISVLVIEAGKFDKDEDFVTIPGLAGGAIGTEYDWNVSYAENAALKGRSVEIPLGKVVGGSTKLNRMVFDRGAKSDYDGWVELGNEGWGWKGLIEYFRKNENFTPPVQEIAEEYNTTYDLEFHGTEGYVQSTYAPFFWPTTKNFVAATRELGIPISYDQANGNAIGGYYCPHNQDPVTQERSSAREAYYETVRSRPNLDIVTGRRVTRVITSTEEDSVRATGVEFSSARNATRYSVSARREIVLAAGAIHTPQLLQVSGIGDSKFLDSVGVETIVDLPAVGHNLQDHVLLTVVNSINATLVSANLTNNETFAAEARTLYDRERLGPYTSPTGEFLAFLPVSAYSNASAAIHASASHQNNTSYLPHDAPAEVRRGYQRELQVLNSKLRADDSAMLEVLWGDGAVVLGLQHPYSRGSVKAMSANVFDGVLADAAFLQNPLDITLMAEGVRFARKLMATQAMASLAPFEILPGGNVTSDAALEEFVRSTAATLYHPAGSCKMGPREEGGVVDQELKVYYVEGLRVVDASVIPLLPATHLMTTVYAIAERAADIIKR